LSCCISPQCCSTDDRIVPDDGEDARVNVGELVELGRVNVINGPGSVMPIFVILVMLTRFWIPLIWRRNAMDKYTKVAALTFAFREERLNER